MIVIWNESLWFLQSDEGMIIGNDDSIKYRISGNSDYYYLCCHIKERLQKSQMSLSELSEYLALSLPPAVIKDVVANLFNLGLIVEYNHVESEKLHPLSDFFVSFPGKVATAIKNFNASKLLIVGHKKLLNIFREISAEYDLKNVTWQESSEDKPIQNDLNQCESFDLIIGVASNVVEAIRLFPMLNKYAIKNNVSLLLGGIEGKNAHLGPLIIPGETACYNCVEIRKENNLPNLSEYQLFKSRIHDVKINQVKAANPIAQYYMCTSIFFDAIKFLAKAQMPATYQHVNIYDTDKQKIESHYLVKVPLCDLCGAHSVKPFSKIWCV